MARKLEKGKPAVQPSAPKGADDLDVLHPVEIEIEVGGETLVMREYSFLDGMRLQATLDPLMREIAETAWKADSLDIDQVQQVLAGNTDALAVLMGKACGKPPAFFEGLSDAEGYEAMVAWWAANADFFVRRVGKAVATLAMDQEKIEDAIAAASDGPMSTPTSSPTATRPTP